MIAYRIDFSLHASHRFRVTLTVPQPGAEQRLSLPVWIPGSYLVREFGRHLSRLCATQRGEPVALTQVDKTTWTAHCQGSAALTLSYEVYAFDASVRTAYLDADRGFFNGTGLCLRVEGREAEPHAIELAKLPKGWQVATAMHAVKPTRFEASDYDELVDHPFELGDFWRGSFKAAGVTHEFVVAGAWPGFDGERLMADTQRICEQQIAFWHGSGTGKASKAGKPPFDRYVFMLNAVDEGYGGLEHRASTALIAKRADLPRADQTMTDGYCKLLGLISHEYFHTWNVKRLRPAEFASFDYTRENYTELLWFFEGFTSYYDELFLLRAGLIDGARYLQLLGTTLNGVLATPGRKLQSVAQASFDAWVKYYRPDENTPNATVSYYTKGSLVALALDLSMRGRGKGNLDAVMRALWVASQGGPISEADIARELVGIGGKALRGELAAWVHGTDELPLLALLKAAGVDSTAKPQTFAASLGLRLSEGPVTGVQVRGVLRDSPAETAGVQAGDELIAVDGWRVRRLDDASQWVARATTCELTLVRDQRLRSVTLTLPQPVPSQLTLCAASKPPARAAALRHAWWTG